MPRPIAAITGMLLIIAGLVGLYAWWGGGYARDNSYGLFMLSVIGVLSGAHLALKTIGINLFGTKGSGDSGTSLFDGDGD
jgi:hypothetical protein